MIDFDYRTWLTLTGSYGNALPIDWSKCYIKELQTKSLHLLESPVSFHLFCLSSVMGIDMPYNMTVYSRCFVMHCKAAILIYSLPVQYSLLLAQCSHPMIGVKQKQTSKGCFGARKMYLETAFSYILVIICNTVIKF